MPGSGLHTEIALLERNGLSPRAALAAATGGAAAALRLSDRGRIAAGLRADLLLLAADPRRGSGALDHIERVFAAGREVDRAALLERARRELR
jgi:imidazolonepropionase-like amidohydrolase